MVYIKISFVVNCVEEAECILQLKQLSFFYFRLNDSEIERHHFKDTDMYSDKSDRENDHDHDESDNDGLGESDTDTSERQDDSYIDPDPDNIKETTYIEEAHEELGEVKIFLHNVNKCM